jgi:hypothetical protein
VSGKVNRMRATGEYTMGERLTGAAPEVSRLGPDLVELSLLLPQWQVEALELAARGRGLTAGQMLRRLIGHYCSTLPAAGR